jgi:imidazolonepropionase
MRFLRVSTGLQNNLSNMNKTLITHIHQLVNVRQANQLLRGPALAALPVITDAYLLLQDDVILEYGTMQAVPAAEPGWTVYDAQGATVLPAWVDSHTHLVFAGSRESEFVDKIKGLTYAEIAAKGGGILNSASRLAGTSEEELYAAAHQRLHELMALGTGAIEIKSGYGLSAEAELKMLRVIKRLKATSPITIKATLLAAHTYPLLYKEQHQEYIDVITRDILPVVAQEGLADYVDVFCETGFFSPEEMQQVCEAANGYGLRPKLHVNQLNSIGGLQKAIELKALSADHLETMTDEDIAALAASGTIGTLLPTAAFFLRMNYQPARRLIDAGCAIALASDYNPGSSPSGNMNFVTALSCIQLKMLPEEAINAATINAAYALELQDSHGSIMIGKKANLVFTRPIPSVAYLAYAFGTNLVDKVMINGQFLPAKA